VGAGADGLVLSAPAVGAGMRGFQKTLLAVLHRLARF
jgi:hypothetical protein